MHYFMVIASVASLALALTGLSCLPADTRPPPATINLRASLAEGQETAVTADGWTIAVERLLVDLGNGSAGDACISYSDAGYDRLLDVTRAGDQKLSTLYPLGQCDLQFRMSGPSGDSLLGAGVTDADKLLLGLSDVDREITQPASISFDLTASATKGHAVERLHWSFRQTVRYRTCNSTANGSPPTPIDFQSNETMDLHIDIHPEALWRDDVTPTAALRFDPIAMADTVSGNDDGQVTLDELGQVPFGGAPTVDPYGIGDADVTKILTLEDVVYLVMLPSVAQFREPISCVPMAGPRRSD